MLCKCGYKVSSEITQTLICPMCGQINLVRSKLDQGRFAWTLLHSRINPTRDWYESQWLPQVPSHGCLCRDEWLKLTSVIPPDFRSPAVFHLWAILAHNQTNVRLGKPQWPDDFALPEMSCAISQAVAKLLLADTATSTFRSEKLNLALTAIAS